MIASGQDIQKMEKSLKMIEFITQYHFKQNQKRCLHHLLNPYPIKNEQFENYNQIMDQLSEELKDYQLASGDQLLKEDQQSMKINLQNIQQSQKDADEINNQEVSSLDCKLYLSSQKIEDIIIAEQASSKEYSSEILSKINSKLQCLSSNLSQIVDREINYQKKEQKQEQKNHLSEKFIEENFTNNMMQKQALQLTTKLWYMDLQEQKIKERIYMKLQKQFSFVQDLRTIEWQQLELPKAKNLDTNFNYADIN